VSDYLVVHWYMGLSVVKHARQTLIQALRNEGIEFFPWCQADPEGSLSHGPHAAKATKGRV
jgi:hypothetical protein